MNERGIWLIICNLEKLETVEMLTGDTTHPIVCVEYMPY